MIVFKDLISSDEMMTDAFPQKPVVDDSGVTIEGMFEVCFFFVQFFWPYVAHSPTSNI